MEKRAQRDEPANEAPLRGTLRQRDLVIEIFGEEAVRKVVDRGDVVFS